MVVLKADQRSHDGKFVNWDEAAIRELLAIFAFTGSLQIVCERMHRFRKITSSVIDPKSDHPGTNHGTHFHVFSGMALWKSLNWNRN